MRYIHLLAVAVGLGISFLADISVFRRLKYPLSADLLDGLHWWHKLVTFALAAMWVSGGVMVYLRTGFVWAEFSPKLIAKIMVVTILTINALLIGAYAMPNLDRKIGVSPLNLPPKMKFPMALVSGVSTTSWLLALALGSSAILKVADANVFMVLLPACYVLTLLASICAVSLFQIRSPNVAPNPK